MGTGTVDSWGLKVLMISSAELEISIFSNRFLMGSYANWGVYIQDTGDPTEEKHGIANLGFLFPLNETRQFQFLLETSVRVKREVKFPASREEDYKGITPSFRYLSKRIAFTLGWQHRLKDAPNKNSSLVIFNGSYYF